MMMKVQFGMQKLEKEMQIECLLGKAWRAIQAGMPDDVIISSDIGNNCAIGNAYPTFENGRKYLAPGLFGPCGYGFPSILGAKIGCPDTPVL